MKNKNRHSAQLSNNSLSQFKRAQKNEWITDTLFGAGISACFTFMMNLLLQY